MTGVVYASGFIVLAVMAVMMWYLAAESKFAFNQTFPFGYRFAATGLNPPSDYAMEFDPNVVTIGAHPESSDDIDDNEMSDASALADLKGTTEFSLGAIVQTPDAPTPSLKLMDRRAPSAAEKGKKFKIAVFATPDATGDRMVLRWEPDHSYIPELSPYNLHLRLVKSPESVKVDPIDIDLKKQPSGKIELPVFKAQSDEDRLKGYEFEVAAEPGASTFVATVQNLIKSDWAPTLQYPRFGILALFFGTLVTTFLAVLLAAPLGITLAFFLSEIASPRFREIAKPGIELLASVPTVVLGFFGLGFIAPGLMNTIGPAIGMKNGHAMITAAVTMAVLLIPIITTVSEDALSRIPSAIRESSIALGLTSRETLTKVIFPAARPGLMAAVLLGVARAIGETMILWMLNGSTPSLPKSAMPLDLAHALGASSKGLPDTIGSEMANVVNESSHYGHLFLFGLILLIFSVALNVTGFHLVRRRD